MATGQEELPTHLSPNTASGEYSAHLDQSRQGGRRQQLADSFDYTRKDVWQRVTSSIKGSAKNASSLKANVLGFPKYFTDYTSRTVSFYRGNPGIFAKEVFSGVTVALLQVPESVAFSYVAGLDSMFGLYATVFMGSLTAIFGGKPGMISGAAGALAVVLTKLTRDDGPLGTFTKDERIEHILMAVVLCGAFQIVFGLLGLARFVSLIPSTAMIGFLNGLAIIIFLAQLPTFETCTDPDLMDNFEECGRNETNLEWMGLDQGVTWMNLVIIGMTMLIMHFFPKIPKIGPLLPASLVAVIVGTTFEFGINRRFIHWDVRTVRDTAPIGGDFPTPQIPQIPGNADWGVIMSTALTLAAIGLFESIMTLQAVNEITKTTVTIYACNAESVAQGLGNLVSGFFRAMGGDAMIGQSTINVLNGARYRLSGFVAGVFMLIIILVASPAIELIPVACLAGVLFMVVLHTFYWPSFLLLFRLHVVDAIAIIGVTVLAVVTNLAVAVIAGIVWQALVNVWENGKLLSCETRIEQDKENEAIKIYEIKGPLSFGSANQFRQFFDIANDPAHVIVDFKESLVCDFSSVVAIREVSRQYAGVDKRMTLRHVCHRSRGQLKRDRDWVIKDRTDPERRTLNELEIFHTNEPPLNTEGMQPEELLDEIIAAGDIEVEDSPKSKNV